MVWDDVEKVKNDRMTPYDITDKPEKQSFGTGKREKQSFYH
jgi:hypothetical protein